jgi:hypothetical protein
MAEFLADVVFVLKLMKKSIVGLRSLHDVLEREDPPRAIGDPIDRAGRAVPDDLQDLVPEQRGGKAGGVAGSLRV